MSQKRLVYLFLTSVLSLLLFKQYFTIFSLIIKYLILILDMNNIVIIYFVFSLDGITSFFLLRCLYNHFVIKENYKINYIYVLTAVHLATLIIIPILIRTTIDLFSTENDLNLSKIYYGLYPIESGVLTVTSMLSFFYFIRIYYKAD